jgi:hypothetical protein
MQAALETMKWLVPKQNCALVRTELPRVYVQNGNEEKPRTSIAVYCTLMTRYCSSTREMIFKWVPAVSMKISLKYRLTMHIGTGATPSKTEARYFPAPRRSYSEADTSRLDALDYLGNLVGFIDLRRNSNTMVRCASFSNLRCRR